MFSFDFQIFFFKIALFDEHVTAGVAMFAKA